jgi:hypothetical protein
MDCPKMLHGVGPNDAKKAKCGAAIIVLQCQQRFMFWGPAAAAAAG